MLSKPGRKKFVQESPYNVGVDCAILMNPETWVASGHVGGFSDPLMDCKECRARFRADKLIDDYFAEKHLDESSDGWTNEKSVPGSQKNSSSICSNSRVRKVKFPGVISLRNDFPI